MGKSAQILFHVWLADAMEGCQRQVLNCLYTHAFATSLKYNTKTYHNLKNENLTQNNTEFPYKYGTVEYAILIGLMLGDGHLRLSANKKTARYAQTCKYKEPLIDLDTHKIPFIFNAGVPAPYPNEKPTQYTRSSKTYSHLQKVWSLWYINNPISKARHHYIKILPKQMIYDHFSVHGDILMAYWFMNDGYWENDDKTFLFCTESFSKLEVDFLRSQLKRMGIKAGTRKRGNGYRIRVSRYSVVTFRELIQKHLLPVYMYKLGTNSSTSQ